MYVGMDIHKKSIQISMVDSNGRELSNTKIPNTIQDIDEFFADVPHDAGVVMESSSVSQNVFLHLRRSGYDPVLSNPYKTKPIAYAKIKTDKIDAHTLAEMLRGDFIPKCYVPPKRIREARYLIRHRKNLSDMRKRLRHQIHAILLGGGIHMEGTPFSKPYVKKLRDLNDYRIGDYLDVLDLIADKIREADRSILDRIGEWPDDSAKALLTVPGIGPYTTLLILAEIGDISRFPNSGHLCSYVGLVPSTYSSGETTYHGHITKRGSRLLRSAMVASVQSHRQGHPDGQIAAFYDRIAAKHGNAKAMVAAGAKLLRVVYCILTEMREYTREAP